MLDWVVRVDETISLSLSLGNRKGEAGVLEAFWERSGLYLCNGGWPVQVSRVTSHQSYFASTLLTIPV